MDAALPTQASVALRIIILVAEAVVTAPIAEERQGLRTPRDGATVLHPATALPSTMRHLSGTTAKLPPSEALPPVPPASPIPAQLRQLASHLSALAPLKTTRRNSCTNA